MGSRPGPRVPGPHPYAPPDGQNGLARGSPGTHASPGGARRRAFCPFGRLPSILNSYGPEPARQGWPAPQPAPPPAETLASHLLAPPGDRPRRGHRAGRRVQLGGERPARRPLIGGPGWSSERHRCGQLCSPAGKQPQRPPGTVAFTVGGTGAGAAQARKAVPHLRDGTGLHWRRRDAQPFVAAGLVPVGREPRVHGACPCQPEPAVPLQHGRKVRVGGRYPR